MGNKLSKPKDIKIKKLRESMVLRGLDIPVEDQGIVRIRGKMDCNQAVHNELIDMECGEIISLDNNKCPFCDEKITEYKTITEEPCCNKYKPIYDKGQVCTNCGASDVYSKYETPYIDFHENKYKFIHKSIYNPKYRILQILNSYRFSNKRLIITHDTQNKILKIFTEIYKQNNIKEKRKRMISIHYLIRCVFEMLKLDYKFIQQPKSKKTINYYKKCWQEIIRLNGDKINAIIHK